MGYIDLIIDYSDWPPSMSIWDYLEKKKHERIKIYNINQLTKWLEGKIDSEKLYDSIKIDEVI